MKFKMVHNNINVYDLDKSLEFYSKALGLKEQRRSIATDGRYIIVFLGDDASEHKLELTWLRDWSRPYNLGDNEIHLAFTADDYEGAYKLHKGMGCICQNDNGNFYFIEDPDGYWIEILRSKK